MTTNKTSWLKFALLAVVCQVAFLTGTMTTHAEETEPSVTASQVFSTSEEAKVTAPEEVTSRSICRCDTRYRSTCTNRKSSP